MLNANFWQDKSDSQKTIKEKKLFEDLVNSFKSFNCLTEFSKELIKSSNNFFSLITFFEFSLSCQKFGSNIFLLCISNLE